MAVGEAVNRPLAVTADDGTTNRTCAALCSCLASCRAYDFGAASKAACSLHFGSYRAAFKAVGELASYVLSAICTARASVRPTRARCGLALGVRTLS